jgi:hypothetical protein
MRCEDSRRRDAENGGLLERGRSVRRPPQRLLDLGREAADRDGGDTGGRESPRRQQRRVRAPEELRQPRRERHQHAAAAGHGRRLEGRAQCPPGPEERHLHGRDRRALHIRDLVVGEAGELAQNEYLALRRRQLRERVAQLLRLERRLVGRDRLVERLLAQRAPEAAAAHVLGDREQPGARRLGLRPAQHRPVGVDERRLGHVLRVLDVAEVAEGRAEDVVAVPAVQALDGAIRVLARLPCPTRLHGARTRGNLGRVRRLDDRPLVPRASSRALVDRRRPRSRSSLRRRTPVCAFCRFRSAA